MSKRYITCPNPPDHMSWSEAFTVSVVFACIAAVIIFSVWWLNRRPSK